MGRTLVGFLLWWIVICIFLTENFQSNSKILFKIAYFEWGIDWNVCGDKLGYAREQKNNVWKPESVGNLYLLTSSNDI